MPCEGQRLDGGRRQHPIRVAIIDSGIDSKDLGVSKHAHRIIEKRNFTSPQTESYDDSDGHGTMVTRLLLEAAPLAQVYIAKITDSGFIPASRFRCLARVSLSSSANKNVEQSLLCIKPWLTNDCHRPSTMRCRYGMSTSSAYPLLWKRPMMTLIWHLATHSSPVTAMRRENLCLPGRITMLETMATSAGQAREKA